ncbi:MAG: hypothetical protein IIA00_10615 [Proteobacteria bacterium]|nr:hypothetical protein [Pseudomonadota bacterium]
MKAVMFGERVLVRELVPNSDSLPTEISELTMMIAREAGLENVLRIMESPEGIDAVTFMQNLWSGTKKMK